jgi:hypothetical protein
MNKMTAKQISDLNIMNPAAGAANLGERLDISQAKTGTPVNAVNGTATLVVNSVVVDGDTLTINNPNVSGTDVYEFLADTEQTKTVPTNIAVNITASTTKATVTLTLDTQPTAGQTMTIGTKLYTFVAVGADNADGKISVGADLAACKLNVVAAINGSGFNQAHPLVTAATFSGNTCLLTARVGGTIGNAITTAETMTGGNNAFSAVTFTNGANCSAANAITALVAAITASDTQGVDAVDGAGDTVVLTADTAGVAGNSIAIIEAMINGAFVGNITVLAGGINGTVGYFGEMYIDATYLYTCVADNTISGKNWRRISLGSVY